MNAVRGIMLALTFILMVYTLLAVMVLVAL